MDRTSLKPESISVSGASVTSLTQCAHWNSPLDIVAIKHACCHKFYACVSCHNEHETHRSKIWLRAQRKEKAVLCGVCKSVLTIEEYMECGSRCINCQANFNPGCKGHWNQYFEVDDSEVRN